MMNLKHRSYKKELLDDEDIDSADLRRNLDELNFINTWLGGHKVSIEGFKKLLQKEKKITVCEIGCGGGDNIFAIARWCARNGVEASFIGIDMKPVCIDFAKQKNGHDSAEWIVSDYAKVKFHSKPDIIFSSLFCHHFTDEQLAFQLAWMKENSKHGFFINDLERNRIAHQLIKWLTRLFSRSYLVKNDAPLSVARGFKKDEWKKLLKEADVYEYVVENKWAFRHLVVCKHE